MKYNSYWRLTWGFKTLVSAGTGTRIRVVNSHKSWRVEGVLALCEFHYCEFHYCGIRHKAIFLCSLKRLYSKNFVAFVLMDQTTFHFTRKFMNFPSISRKHSKLRSEISIDLFLWATRENENILWHISWNLCRMPTDNSDFFFTNHSYSLWPHWPTSKEVSVQISVLN